MIKAFCLVSDFRFDRIAKWAKNSFEYTNPGIELIIFDLNDPKYAHYDFHKWNQDTINHEFRVLNPYGILKNIAALELMEKEGIDTLIMLGADVITVGSFDKALEVTDVDILTSRDIGSAPYMPLNPDVQVVFGKTFLQKTIEIYMQQMQQYTLQHYHMHTYQEMALMNYVCNEGLVRHRPLHAVYGSIEECFNKNVRNAVEMTFQESTEKVIALHSFDVITIHVQTGLGSFKEAEFNQKLFGCMNTSPAFSDQGVRTFIEKITKDNIW